MNYYGPRERMKDGKTSGVWDYTNLNNDVIYPIGYCQGWEETLHPTLIEFFGKEQVAEYDKQRRRFFTKYHKDGHKTAEEARNCYRQWLLDNDITTTKYEPAKPCHQCEKPTENVVVIGSWPRYSLCEEHPLLPFLERNFKVGADIWMSS